MAACAVFIFLIENKLRSECKGRTRVHQGVAERISREV